MTKSFVILISCLSLSAAYAQIRSSLRPTEQESGIVTKKEMQVSDAWFNTIVASNQRHEPWLEGWVSTAPPFSFQYKGLDSGALLSKWKLEEKDESGAHELSWADASTGLHTVFHIRKFQDYPAVEWVLTFENRGTKDTPVLENIQPLDLRLNHSGPGDYVVHGVNGGRSMPDDLTPYAIPLPADDLWRKRTQLGGDFPSSNRHLPFFNLESPDGRGVLVGVGWSGNWLSKLEVDGSELRAQSGLKTTHFVLHPGERVRTPRILVLLWEGRRLHSNNMLRQLLYTHYVPKLNGKLQQPLVSVNVCFTYKGYGNFLHDATEKTVEPLVKPFHDLGAELLILDAGWYDGAPWSQWLGNWVYSKTKYPRGFRRISDETRFRKTTCCSVCGSRRRI